MHFRFLFIEALSIGKFKVLGGEWSLVALSLLSNVDILFNVILLYKVHDDIN